MYRLLGCVLVGLAFCAAGLAAQDDSKDRKKETKTGNEVVGKVTYKGKPLAGGTVVLHPAKGKRVVGHIMVDGTYLIKNVPVGEMVVTIETESVRAKPGKGPIPKIQPKEKKTEPKDKKLPDEAKAAARYVAIPRIYGDVKTSPLRYTVQSGKQTLNLELQ